MLLGVLQNHSHCSFPYFGRKPLCCLSAHCSTFSSIGASGNPGAIHIAEEVEPKKRSRGSNLQRNQAGAIHIEFARARVSIEGPADAAMVRAVLECLAG